MHSYIMVLFRSKPSYVFLECVVDYYKGIEKIFRCLVKIYLPFIFSVSDIPNLHFIHAG